MRFNKFRQLRKDQLGSLAQVLHSRAMLARLMPDHMVRLYTCAWHGMRTKKKARQKSHGGLQHCYHEWARKFLASPSWSPAADKSSQLPAQPILDPRIRRPDDRVMPPGNGNRPITAVAILGLLLSQFFARICRQWYNVCLQARKQFGAGGPAIPGKLPK